MNACIIFFSGHVGISECFHDAGYLLRQVGSWVGAHSINLVH